MGKAGTGKAPQPLMQQLRAHQRETFRTLGPAGILTIIGFIITFFFIEPAPPRSLVIATGPESGNYYAAGRAYADFLAAKGISLEVRATAGSVENFELLTGDNSIDLAIVQGGSAPSGIASGKIEALASLYLEPLWIFHRKDLSAKRLEDFAGKNIGVGPVGSGSGALATLLFDANAVAPDDDAGTRFINADLETSIRQLRENDVDAIVLVLSPESPIILELLGDPALDVFSFERNAAYAKKFGFLKAVTLDRGVIDLREDLPTRPLKLVAPYANLVASRALHDAIIPLLLDAATSQHYNGGLLADAGELPSLIGSEFQPSEISRDYLTHGPSMFQRHLNFWVASLIDRAKIMLIPLVALLFPLIKLAPPIYRWRIRSRIYNWYAILQGVDNSLQSENTEELKHYEKQLKDMETELASLEVPLSYMQEFYNLHLHLDLVKRRITEKNLMTD